MASSREKHYYIEHEKLREKYRSNFDRIRTYAKAIAESTQTKIVVDRMPNGTVRFVITGGGKRVDRALKDIQTQFEQGKYVSKPASQFLRPKDHKKLQKERNVVLLTTEALHKHDIMTGAIQLRQFACAQCDLPWWAKVPCTKPVSHCRICRTTYDALDRDQEFGIGRFMCLTCDREFYSRCEATDTRICYKCKMFIGSPFISPRFKGIEPIRRKRDERLYYPRTGAEYREMPKVINASNPHISTGSTIASFLTQDIGPNIDVVLESQDSMEAANYRQPDPYHRPEGDDDSDSDDGGDSDGDGGDGGDDSDGSDDGDDGGGDDDYSECLSTSGAASDLESFRGDDDSELDSDFADRIRRRTAGSDSSDSDTSDDDSGSGKVPSAGHDSGIGTGSHSGTGSDTRSVSSLAKQFSSISVCELKPTDYPGIVFSKEKAERTVTNVGTEIVGEGIKLHVPYGAVPDDETVTISLQACIGGPFIPPDGLEFVSPVYLIEPPFAFRKELTLSIDFFVELGKNQEFEDLVFVTSSTNYSKRSNEPQWKFRTFGSPRFSRGSICGKGYVDLKHFCFCGFASKFKKKLVYSSILCQPSFFYPPQSHCVFSVTLHHEVYFENLKRFLKEYYFCNESETFKTVTKSCSFTDKNCITFVLPAEEEIKRQGYKLSPDMTPCEILKEQVDYAIHHKKRAMKEIALYPPRCTLKIISCQDELKPLDFALRLDGISQKFTFNVLLLPSNYSSKRISSSTSSSDSISSEDTRSSGQGAGLISQSSSGYSSQGSREGLDDEPSFRALWRHLHPQAAHWETVALCLDFNGDETMAIEMNERTVEDKLRRVLRKWERLRKPPYTWRTIIEILEEPAMEASVTASNIRAEIERTN